MSQGVLAPWTEPHVSVVMSETALATKRRLRICTHALATANKGRSQRNKPKRLEYEESRGQFDYQAM
ncbi:hypothetical protein HaLaN_01156 [Haematococcus lacustris]|uniref:Uncharacterized protein n=1 Tax=Haematococcus lacustris TaxID=44745 RepID=A0A699YB07_HAELA|nr:hypothetical protein HaLaN_01156 [Haematococcus lacustris]